MTETAPEGYQTAETFGDAMMGLICEQCWCVVPRSKTAEHDKWHRRQTAASIIGPGLF